MSTETESSKRWHLSGVLRRKWLIILASVVLLFLVVHLVLSFITGYRLEKTVARIEQKYGPLNPLRFAPPMVPYEQNRARLIRAALEAMVYEAPFGGIAGSRIPTPQMIQERMVLLRSILAKNVATLYLLDEAIKCPRADWHIDYRNVLDTDSPPLMRIIRLAGILQVKALVEIQDGRPEGASAAIRALISISDSCSQERTLAIQIIRQNNLDHLACSLVRYLLTQAQPAPADLAEIQRLLRGSLSPDSMWQSVVCEMAAWHQVLARIETGDWLWSDLEKSPLSPSGLVRWILLPATRDGHRYFLEYSERVVDAVRASSLKPWSNPRPVEIRAPHWWQFLSKEVLWWTPGRFELRTRVGRDRIVLATTAIALRRFKLDHGHYPDELAALVPDYLDRVPDDAFTLKPPDYKREGEGFVLWSAEGEKTLDQPQTPYDSVHSVLHWSIPR